MFHSRTKESGFTLIELLVVIAIIGLLAAIIFASLESARDRANNSAKTQLVSQYIRALELYATDNNGYYPNIGDGNNNYCLGETNGVDKCQYNKSGNDTLISVLDKYIPGVPNSTTPVPYLGRDYYGITYACDRSDISDPCNNYILTWYLVNTNGCNLDRTAYTFGFLPNATCTYFSDK